MAPLVYIQEIMKTTTTTEQTVTVTLKTPVRNQWDLTSDAFLAMGVGAVATYEKDGRWIASVVIFPTYSVGSRNDFATEQEAIDACERRAHYAHGVVFVR